MTHSPSPSERGSAPVKMLRRLRDAAETRRRLAEPASEAVEPVLPAMRRLLDRLRSAETLDALPPTPEGDGACLFAYRARPEANAPFLRFHVAEAEADLLRFVGLPSAGFEILQVQQAGLQFHWRSDLVRAYDEQAAILGAFCAFVPHGELVLEHLVVPVIRRHRVRELRGWIALGHDLTDDICGPDRLAMTRRPLRSRDVRLPRRLLRQPVRGSALAGAAASLQERWGRSAASTTSR